MSQRKNGNSLAKKLFGPAERHCMFTLYLISGGDVQDVNSSSSGQDSVTRTCEGVMEVDFHLLEWHAGA
jgi:hypothetical protein